MRRRGSPLFHHGYDDRRRQSVSVGCQFADDEVAPGFGVKKKLRGGTKFCSTPLVGLEACGHGVY